MKQFLVGVMCSVLAAFGAWAQPGPGGAGHARGGDRANTADRAPAHQREELRELIRAQRVAARDDDRAQRAPERSPRQLSPQERELLREQLRQQRREQRGSP